MSWSNRNGIKIKESGRAGNYALTPLTEDVLEGVNKVTSEKEEKEVAEVKEEKIIESKPVNTSNGGVFKLHIGEGKDIDIEIPMGNLCGNNVVENTVQENSTSEEVVAMNEKKEARIMGNLTKKYYKIDEVKLADETKIKDNVLYLRKNVCEDAVDVDDLVLDISFDIITPDRYDEYSETLMDIQPIATKVEGELGNGVTKVIDGVVVVVTGTDENGVQIGEFGSSEGIIDKNVMWNRPGAPDKGDIFIKTEVKIVSKMNMERPGPFAAHKATDFITQEIRDALKDFEGEVLKEENLTYKRNAGKKKVVIIKEIMGQGAMHDNLILPFEPVGILGGKPNVDLGNLPIVLSPLEVLDGGVHALTCIGPASKETSRHYWREPLVREALLNEDIDLCGVIFVGSPQVNSEKFYVSKRLGALVEMLDVD
jgi:D-proline reductase (dithiol) PrdA